MSGRDGECGKPHRMTFRDLRRLGLWQMGPQGTIAEKCMKRLWET